MKLKQQACSKTKQPATLMFHETEQPYFNREISWLAFNRRVLEQAQEKTYPLLERMRYLCFVNSNLDEFFEIRVAGLLQQVQAEVNDSDIDGLSSSKLLTIVQNQAQLLVKDCYYIWQQEISPLLEKEKIFFKNSKQLNQAERSWVSQYFKKQVYPVLTPLAIDPSHPFPQIANKTLNVLAWIYDEEDPDKPFKMAIIPVPRILPRVVRIENSSNQNTFIFLSDIIETHAPTLFPGYQTKGAWAFRITRNSDLYINEEEAENLLKKIEDELSKMRKGDAVRLEIQSEIPQPLLKSLLHDINLNIDNTFFINGPINLLRLMEVYDLIKRPDLKFDDFTPYTPPILRNPENIFQTLRRQDIFLHHPYESFEPVIDFIQTAAKDHRVFAIKQTLYRTSGDSPIVQALMEASQKGKQVTVLVELKARFDEMNNIQWARQLEEVGVHVVYGILGLKTHCKCCLVVRREDKGLLRYGHLGTGNYNPKTATLYTDYSLMTTRKELTSEMADLFNSLTGFSKNPKFKKLLVAPFNLHSAIQKLIKAETSNAKKGLPARIIVKCNSLIDKQTIDHLYQASQAGVLIDLIIRGICGLIPGVKGLSDNIRVRSILGRYLEHSRIYYFKNSGANPHILMGSADWMPRNFFRRIEQVFPVDDKGFRKKIMEVLMLQLRDTVQAKILQSNGTYTKPKKTRAKIPINAQENFMENAKNLHTVVAT